MNYAYLAKKYVLGADVIVEDRTYEGLVWRGPGEKPTEAQFASYQERENQGGRSAAFVAQAESSQMLEIQKQARAAANHDALSFREKAALQYQEIYEECKKKTEEAIGVVALLRARDTVLDCWQEITAAQAAINEESQKYLEDTAHFLAWDPGKIPKDIAEKRAQAHERLDFGKTVYADWASLRSKEMPSRSELLRAISLGGEHLEKMRALCKAVVLRYPAPKKNHY